MYDTNLMHKIWLRTKENMQNKRITYTVKFNQSQLIDLIDTDSVNQLITFNDDTTHVYIMEVEKTNHDSTPHEDNDDNVHDSTLSSNSTQGVDVVTNIYGQNPLTPILCTTQLVPTTQLKVVRYRDHNVMVRGSNVDVCVNLLHKECTCLEWQMTGIPCPDACAAIKLLHGNIYTYVEECYLKSSQEKIYEISMIPIETHDMSDLNNLTLTDWENNIFLMPPTTTRPPGRPYKKRRESQFQDMRVYKCSRCDQSGHNRSKCRNLNPERI
ncbi:uncharacterized protein LOC110271180 [Arachis ipaensis]|uniref:Zinc finger PMZ-type domain-containing protein n=1 Tax=Arachis hypogaea TaxID=3818 RepID=A0A444ZKG6_ARAHY|nr:uncharacterized protein LOC110271180 [Arachis ipaensis]XP_025648908.1 uncharacterized protein LOC112743787 [Arachis hypogaea]RYR14660.1 hypothetical protein Ahy_B04g071324 isoform E [Arachis hypogaea]